MTLSPHHSDSIKIKPISTPFSPTISPISPTSKRAISSLDQAIHSSNTSTRSNSPSLPSLDDLVNDCFLNTIGLLHDDSKIKLVNDFTEYLTKQHTEENLKFLIDIYRYEYYYNLKFHPTLADGECLEQDRINNTPSPNNMGNATMLSPITQQHDYSATSLESLQHISKTRSIQSEDLDPQYALISTIDDLDDVDQVNDNVWDNFQRKFTDDDDDDDDIHDENNADEQLEEEDEDYKSLTKEWKYIMNTYVKYDSPMQINISQKLFKEIVEESSVLRLHNPLTLIKAKNEVLRMLKENGYFGFGGHLRKLQKQQEEENSKASSMASSFSPTSPSISINDVHTSPSSNEITPTSKARDIPTTPKDIKNARSGNPSPTLSPSDLTTTENGSFFSKLSSLPKRSNKVFAQNPNSTSSPTSSVSSLLGHLKLGKDSSGSSNSSLSDSQSRHAHSRARKHSHQHQIHRSHQHHIQRPGTFHGTSSNSKDAAYSSDTSSICDLRSLNASPVSVNGESSGVSSLKFWSKKKS
ncbi:hypothetical protein SBY92_001341 [Candida maltosa Xu316]